MNMKKHLYTILLVPLALLSACAYNEDYEVTENSTDAFEIGDRYYYGCDSLTCVTLSEAVRTIGDQAFFGSSIVSLGIPSGVLYIGSNAFNFCTNLTSITIDERNPVFDSRDNCNAIIRTVDDLLVYGCVGTSIPQSVRSIAQFAFCGCDGLGDLVLPENVENIGDGAFSECHGLTSVVLPSHLSQISTLAFSDCPDLTSVVIPQSVATIGDGAFLHCCKLSDIHVRNMTPPQCGYIAFFGTSATLYVPRGTREDYAFAYGWRDFKTIIEE